MRRYSRVVIGLLLLIAAALPAVGSAHSNRNYIDSTSYSSTSSDHYNAYACDNKSDGKTGYVRFYKSGSNTSIRWDDPNGGQPSCGVSGYYNFVASHKYCVGTWPSSDPCTVYINS